MKYINTVYLMMLGIALGIELTAGAFVAPVVFHAERYIGDGVLTLFQSGVLMSQVFLKMNVVVGFISLFSLIYEVQMMLTVRRFYDGISLLLSMVCLVAIGLFVFYYTPYIMQAQTMGVEGTLSETFAKMHKESEWIMKGLMLTQVILLLKRGSFLMGKA